MPEQDEMAWWHSNQYSADSACAYCGGVICCESWCNTRNAIVRYALQVVLHPNYLSFADRLILHALGVTW
jgi:hypothetical protein